MDPKQSPQSPLFDVIVDSCRKLGDEHDDFWLVSSLSDCSYEEGVRASYFKRYVNSWGAEGICQDLLGELELGINGNLAETIRNQPSVRSVSRSPSRGHDIVFSADCPEPFAAIHVKLLFDATYPKYYNSVANDYNELLSGLPDGAREAYLTVFFTQLPFFDYPPGVWHGTPRKKREYHFKGIRAQYQFLLGKLGVPPTWPTNGPYIHSLPTSVSSIPESLIQSRYERVYHPSVDWRFSGIQHLRDAQVGVAVWRRRS